MEFKQRVECVGDEQLRRAAVDGACQAKPEMAFRIEAKRERGLALAARGGARSRRPGEWPETATGAGTTA